MTASMRDSEPFGSSLVELAFRPSSAPTQHSASVYCKPFWMIVSRAADGTMEPLMLDDYFIIEMLIICRYTIAQCSYLNMGFHAKDISRVCESGLLQVPVHEVVDLI